MKTRIACEAINIDFNPDMLHWNEGRIREWSLGEEKSQTVWHQTLENSHTILKPDNDARLEFQVRPEHFDWYERALCIYHGMIESQYFSGVYSNAKNVMPVS